MVDKVSISLDEQETSVNIDYIDKTAYVYSSNSHMCKRLYTMYQEHQDEVKLDIDDKYGIGIVVPMKWIKIAPPAKRTMTDEQRQAIAERFAQYRANKRLENEQN